MHELEKKVSIFPGSLTRLYLSRANEVIGGLNLEDWNILSRYIDGEYKYITTTQKIRSDLDGDGSIDNSDLLYLETSTGLNTQNYQLGDVNQDGEVNVTDILALVSYILGTADVPNALVQYLADVDQDGNINVADIVAIVADILYGNE